MSNEKFTILMALLSTMPNYELDDTIKFIEEAQKQKLKVRVGIRLEAV